jgi:DNA topoisomerase-1
MRTDGVQMAREAMLSIRDHVKSSYGADYIPVAPREYTTKVKNAQEAHEAIRPTDVANTPEKVARYLNPEQRRLYELVWKRAVASQMQSAELDQVSVEVTDGKGIRLRATGSIVAFDGFLKLYREDTDDAAEEDDNRMLPPMAERDPLGLGTVTATQHFTQPPPRYSEASLVKKMEELGIGRPSTYASILTVLQDRNYVRLDKRRFIPEDRGRLVTAFLVSFFNRYVDTGFTAGLEEKLDDITGGLLDWHAVMRAFWDEFSNAVDQTKDLKISDVIAALDQDLGDHFFPAREDGSDPRVCAACGNGRLGLKLGRYGSFIGCSNYPACQYTRKLAIDPGDDGADTLKDGMRVLGHHPDTGEEITVRRGPYGLYVQQGDTPPAADKKAAAKAPKPRRTSLPRGMDGDSMTLEQAIGLLGLPRLVGLHPETQERMEAGIGRFGPYVKMGAVFGSLDRDDDVLALGVNRAVDLLAKKLASVRTLGEHPADKEPVSVRKGRFGLAAGHRAAGGEGQGAGAARGQGAQGQAGPRRREASRRGARESGKGGEAEAAGEEEGRRQEEETRQGAAEAAGRRLTCRNGAVPPPPRPTPRPPRKNSAVSSRPPPVGWASGRRRAPWASSPSTSPR